MFKKQFKTILIISITFIFIGVFSVFAEWPDAPNNGNVGGLLGEVLNLDESNESKLIIKSGKIGIGITNPTRDLDIRKAGEVQIAAHSSISGSSASILTTVDSKNNFYFGVNPTANVGVIGISETSSDLAKPGQNDVISVKANGNVGIGTMEPESTLEVNGSLALKGNTVVRRKNLVNFIRPEGGYAPGQDWAERYYHIRTPDTFQCGEMYRYDLTGYSYGISRPLSFTWVGFLYDAATTAKQIYNQASIDNTNNISASQYVGSDDHLYLQFGPIRQYYNSFVLDYQSGSTEERVNHVPSEFKVFVTENASNL